MFSRFLDSFFNEYIEDEVFGHLKRGKHGGGNWQGSIYFEPTKDKIDIYIRNKEDKVSDKQKEFYREVTLRYSSFIDEIEDLLYKRYIEFGGTWEREDVPKMCRLTSLSIPHTTSLNEKPFEYDLGFSYGLLRQGFVIEMKDWKPEECWAGDSLVLDNEGDR